jgi:N-acyl-phosphatidylethanolamine-hydrolysing phospholipase D
MKRAKENGLENSLVNSANAAHHDGNAYRNPWQGSTPHGFRGVVRWMLTRRRNAAASFSSRDVSLPPPGSSANVPERSKRLAVTWVGHSSFLIQCDGLNILTDPIWSNRASPVSFAGPKRLVPVPLALENLPPIDIVLISHDHYDHLDDSTVRALIARFPRTHWIAPLGVAAFLRRRGAAFVAELDWWDEREVQGATISCTPAQHFSGRYLWNRNATLWCGWTIAFRSMRVFFAGDTALHPEFAEISRRFGPFDMAILPIGAYEPRWFMRTVHMTPEDSVAAFLQLISTDTQHRCVMVASHWGTFKLTDEPIMEPPRLTRETWSHSNLSPDRLWIMTHGETREVPRT